MWGVVSLCVVVCRCVFIYVTYVICCLILCVICRCLLHSYVIRVVVSLWFRLWSANIDITTQTKERHMTYTTTHRQKTLNNPKRKFFFFGVWVVSLTSFVGGFVVCVALRHLHHLRRWVLGVWMCFMFRCFVCVIMFANPQTPNTPTYYEKNETKHLPLKQTTKKKLLRLGVWLCHSIYIVTCVTCVDCFMCLLFSFFRWGGFANI